MRRYRTLLAVSVGGFVAVAFGETQHGLLERHDVSIERGTVAQTPHAAVRAADVVTQLGSWWALVMVTAVAAVYLLRHGRRADALLLLVALGLVSLATDGLKLAFGRPRPSPGSLAPLHHTLSFPSGHTSGATTMFVLVALLVANRYRRAVVGSALVLAGVVGATRVVVQAHWPTDVLAGYCLGVAVLSAIMLVRDRFSVGRRTAVLGWPEGNDDPRQRGGQERDCPGRSFPEHRPHDLLPVNDLAEPRRR